MHRSGIDEITLARFMQKLDPTVMREALIEASGFLALFELLRSAVVLTPGVMYPAQTADEGVLYTKFESGKLIPTRRYIEKVLGGERKNVRQAFERAARWLAEFEAISEEEVDELLELRNYRNEIAHELQEIVIDPDRRVDSARFESARGLLGKIARWRIREIELDPEELAERGLDFASLPDEAIEPGSAMIADLLNAARRAPSPT